MARRVGPTVRLSRLYSDHQCTLIPIIGTLVPMIISVVTRVCPPIRKLRRRSCRKTYARVAWPVRWRHRWRVGAQVLPLRGEPVLHSTTSSAIRKRTALRGSGVLAHGIDIHRCALSVRPRRRFTRAFMAAARARARFGIATRSRSSYRCACRCGDRDPGRSRYRCGRARRVPVQRWDA